MSELVKRTNLLACLLLCVASTYCAVSDAATANVSISKTIPCLSYTPVLKMLSIYGQPEQVMWARAANGQMSKFIWNINSEEDDQINIVTHLSVSGECSIKIEHDKSLNWRVVNVDLY